MARYIAKNIVAAGLAERAEVQLAYAIGVAEPVSVRIETFGTGKVGEAKLTELVRKNFSLTPKGIIESLNLRRPIYQKTAAYGHFGRNEPEFTWEATDKAAPWPSRPGWLCSKGAVEEQNLAPVRDSRMGSASAGPIFCFGWRWLRIFRGRLRLIFRRNMMRLHLLAAFDWVCHHLHRAKREDSELRMNPHALIQLLRPTKNVICRPPNG